jgi:hypothetical protein
VDDELRADRFGCKVIHAAGSVSHVATYHELAAREVLQDVRDQARVVQQTFRKLQVHDETLAVSGQATSLPKTFFISFIRQMLLWISKL